MKRRRKESTLIVVLEWICGIAVICAIVTTTWASLVYRDRNGRFFPEMESSRVTSNEEAKSLSSAVTHLPNANNLEMDPNASSATPIPQQTQGETIKNVSIAGFKTLKFAANTTEVAVDFYNPTSNEGEFLMTFELFLPTASGDYENVYSSGLVDAGQHIRNIRLSHSVSKGTYENCILRIQPYFTSDGSPASTAEVSFTLYAE